MKIFSIAQIKAWDDYTITNQPIPSIDLMENAAKACVAWLKENNFSKAPFHIFCGNGNNGGDGLAIARLLHEQGEQVFVYAFSTVKKTAEDFKINLNRLPSCIQNKLIESDNDFPALAGSNTIIIDAIFGSGLNKPLSGIEKEAANFINQSNAAIISIDIPSGMYADASTAENTSVQAHHTLSFQAPKLGFMMPENAMRIGNVHILNIWLNEDYYSKTKSSYSTLEKEFIKSIYKKRNRFATKHNLSHALLVAGSYGKMGAAVLAAKGCLRSGAGLLTVITPKCGNLIMQTSVPEAMALTDSNEMFIANVPKELSRYQHIGIGPGLGTQLATKNIVEAVLKQKAKAVFDADALNIISHHPNLFYHLHQGCILTPHRREFERMFGETKNDFEITSLAIAKAKALHCYIILKSHHTLIACPDGTAYFNTTGNSGMATGGSGDMLTGILTGLLSQGYSAKDAALFGVYLHGLAGDIAAEELSEEALLAGDITDYIGKAYLSLQEDS